MYIERASLSGSKCSSLCFRVPNVLENPGIFVELGRPWKNLEFNKNLKKTPVKSCNLF